MAAGNMLQGGPREGAGGCGRGSSGTPAWQGEASIRKETKPLAQLEGPSLFLASCATFPPGIQSLG